MLAADFIAIRPSQIHYYRRTPLYTKSAVGEFVLYKPAGREIAAWRVRHERVPQLYFRQTDRRDAINEIKGAFHGDLERKIRSGDMTQVRGILCALVEETLAEPRSGFLSVMPGTVERLITSFSRKPGFIRALAYMSDRDYTTAIHSVNVMALTIAFCQFRGFSIAKTRWYGLAALLHDVGKTEIPEEILTAPRRLTAEEFETMKAHPEIGVRILLESGEVTDSVVLKGVGEHHERLDGSGYPAGIHEISDLGQLLGIIDCYEALTNEDRLYRRAVTPFEALKHIKAEVDERKFNALMFREFCFSQKTD